MRRNKYLLSLAALICSAVLWSQDRDILGELTSNSNRYGGSSAPYEFVEQQYCAAPPGYKPFYISHFGRHGSRMHTSADMFRYLQSVFHKADSMNALTEEGRRAMELFIRAREGMDGKLGELTSVGEEEHREIAARMYENYREVFENGPLSISAQSTTSKRVIESMQSFCSELKDRNPSLDIEEAADDRTQKYLNHYSSAYKEYYKKGPWREIRDDWTEKHLHVGAFTSRLFLNADIFGGKPDSHRARRFAQDLYSLAKIMPSSNLGFGFYDFFSEEELWTLWQIGNMDQYLRKGPSLMSGGLALSIARPLLKDFIDKAEKAVSGQKVCADLRFGHGEGLMPLAGLMGIREASQVTQNPDSIAFCWQDYRVTTMAGNIQWIFYKNSDGEVILKLLLNEREAEIPVRTDIWPYYRWKDVKKYYSSCLPENF